MKLIKYILFAIAVFTSFVLLMLSINYFEFSRTLSTTLGALFMLIYILADRKIFKDW